MRQSILAATLLVTAAACGGSAPPPAPHVTVIQDGAFPDARSVVSPAVLGLQLALRDAVDVVVQDTEGTGGGDVALSVAADPSTLAVVLAPYTSLSAAAIDTLSTSGLPILALSSSVSAPAGAISWRAMVPAAPAEVRVLGAMAEALPGSVCSAGEGTAWSEGFRDLLTRDLPSTTPLGGSPEHAAGSAERHGCGSVIWAGSASGAADLRAALTATIPLIVASPARTEGYLESVGPLDEVQIGACPCSDLSTATSPAAQAFLHAYQRETGMDAGPFAVEGYDAGTLLAGLVEDGADRGEVAASIARVEAYEGLGGIYGWGPGGDLLAPPVRMYQATGVRWLAAASASPRQRTSV